MRYATDNKFDPFSATAPQVADFLSFLFHDRKVSPSSIKGYRAAIGHALRLATGYDPAEDKIITMLIKGFDRRTPKSLPKTPTWDIGLVLNHLAKINDKTVEIPSLLAKAVFLLALASGARRGELWALTNELVLVGDDPKILRIPFRKSFTFKTEFTQKSHKRDTHLDIPMLPESAQSGVCPVTTLLAYLNRTKKSRLPTQNSLFLPKNPSHPNPSKQMISANIVEVIRGRMLETGYQSQKASSLMT
jgi:integrase